MERLVVWKLDNLIGLEQVQELLKRNYNREIEFITKLVSDGRVRLDSPEDAIFKNSWYTEQGDSNFKLEGLEFGDYSLQYISAIGSFEYGFGEKRALIDNYLLSRNKRVFKKECNAIFFEYEGLIYVALQTLESTEATIRGSLLGQGRGEKIKEWGEINQEADPFSFDSTFYYWLLTKKGVQIKFKDKDIDIIDVNAISVLSEGSSYNNTSQGNALLDVCLPALSVLSINEAITKVGLELKIDDYKLVLSFDKNGVVMIDTFKSFKIGNGSATPVFYNDSSNEFILLIFAYIFPALIEAHKVEKNNIGWQESIKGWQKNWAVNVVQTLMRHNEISIKDLKLEVEENEPSVKTI